MVTDDDRNTIGTALVVATAPQHADILEAALQRGGRGLHVQSIGGMYPINAPEDLDYPFIEDPSLDPSIQELWYLSRERDRKYGSRSKLVITGDELRVLVKQALDLRVGFRAAPLTHP